MDTHAITITQHAVRQTERQTAETERLGIYHVSCVSPSPSPCAVCHPSSWQRWCQKPAIQKTQSDRERESTREGDKTDKTYIQTCRQTKHTGHTRQIDKQTRPTRQTGRQADTADTADTAKKGVLGETHRAGHQPHRGPPARHCHTLHASGHSLSR